MKTKKIARISALLLSLVFLLAACGQKPAAGEEARPRRTVDFSEMEYTRPDAPGDIARMLELAALINDADSFEKLKEYDKKAEDITESFYTMSSLASLKRYLNTGDAAREEEVRYCDEQGIALSNANNEVIRAIVDSKFADDYRKEVGDYYFADMKNTLLLNSTAVESLKQERAQLNVDYNQQLGEMTITHEGTEYTQDEIFEIESVDLRLQLYIAYYKENAQQFTDLYAKMVQLDSETAGTLGFGSVAEMYYLSYARDYSPDEAMEYCESSKELFAPLYTFLSQYWWPEGEADLVKDLAAMPAALKTVDKELGKAWDFMMQYNLFDYEARPEKQSGIAFKTNLYAYDAPFCYGYWKGDFGSTTTVMHEFGHFYDGWLHYDDSVVFNLDIAETYSQGLELLMQNEFGKFTDVPEDEVATHLVGFVESLTYQAVLEEFQQKLYKLDTFDAEVIARLYADVQKGYGMSPLVDEKGCDYSWYRVTHLFDAPFYTISYCTSAAAALQIWEMSQDDWKAGADTYLKLIRSDQNQPFIKLMESAGLKNPIDRATLEAISDRLHEEYGLTRGDLPEA